MQAGVEASMAAGSPLTDDQLRVMYGPVFDEIRGKQRAAEMASLASILAPVEGAPPNPVTASFALRALQQYMQGAGQPSPVTLGAGPVAPPVAPTPAPYDAVQLTFGSYPQKLAEFDNAVEKNDYEAATRLIDAFAGDAEQKARLMNYITMMGVKRPRTWKESAESVGQDIQDAHEQLGAFSY